MLYSLRELTKSLETYSKNKNLQELKDRLEFCDNASPTPLFSYLLNEGGVVTIGDLKEWQRYLEVSSHARRKVKVFYPKHSKKYDREVEQLKILEDYIKEKG